MEDQALDEFDKEISLLAQNMATAFETEKYRYHYQADSETLYLEIGGLDAFSEEQIGEIAEPILDNFDLDIEEILILPLK